MLRIQRRISCTNVSKRSNISLYPFPSDCLVIFFPPEIRWMTLGSYLVNSFVVMYVERSRGYLVVRNANWMVRVEPLDLAGHQSASCCLDRDLACPSLDCRYIWGAPTILKFNSPQGLLEGGIKFCNGGRGWNVTGPFQGLLGKRVWVYLLSKWGNGMGCNWPFLRVVGEEGECSFKMEERAEMWLVLSKGCQGRERVQIQNGGGFGIWLAPSKGCWRGERVQF